VVADTIRIGFSSRPENFIGGYTMSIDYLILGCINNMVRDIARPPCHVGGQKHQASGWQVAFTGTYKAVVIKLEKDKPKFLEQDKEDSSEKDLLELRRKEMPEPQVVARAHFLKKSRLDNLRNLLLKEKDFSFIPYPPFIP